jgi:hypothetical protein
MARNFKEKITMRFNVSQLDRTIVALLNNGYNKRFAANVLRLFNLFIEDSFKNDYEKELRVFLVKKIALVITERDIQNKDAILTFLDISGRMETEATEILNTLFQFEIDPKELEMLDKMISQQLRYSIIGNDSTTLSDLIANFQTDNYEDFEKFMENFHGAVDMLGKNLRSARESIEDAKSDLSLGSDSFVTVLNKIIQQDRNPGAKIKSGIRAINEAFNGGFEKGRVYLALGLAKG